MGYHTQRRLTDDEQQELDELNAAVTAALTARRDWLDAKMHETSTLQVGDDIYDINAGMKLGTVSRLYRYQSDNYDGVYDTSVSCDYRYETHPRCFDNTSRQIGLSYGTRDDAVQHADRHAARLRAAL